MKEVYTIVANPFKCDLADFLIWKRIREIQYLRGFVTPQRRFCTVDAKEEAAYMDLGVVPIESRLNGWLLFKCEPDRVGDILENISERFGEYSFGRRFILHDVILQHRHGRERVDLYVYN